MMNICEDGHQEIVYESINGSKCPMCEAMAESEETIKSLENELSEKDKEVDAMEEEIVGLMASSGYRNVRN